MEQQKSEPTQPKKVVLWLMFPMKSHFIPAFPIMDLLKSEGYQIIACGSGWLSPFLTENGYEFYPIDYLTEYRIRSSKALLSTFIKSLFDESFVKGEYHDFLEKVTCFQQIVERTKPEMVFLDEDLSSYHYFIDKDIKRFILNTKLSIRRQNAVPPFTYFYVPLNIFWIDQLVAFGLWTKQNFKNLSLYGFNKLALLGKDETFHIKHYLRKKRPAVSANIKYANVIYPVVDEQLTTFILCSEGLEYQWKNKPPFEHYVKFKSRENIWKLSDEQALIYESVKTKIIALKNQNKKFIFCAMGSMSSGYVGSCQPFYEKLAQATESIDNTLLLILTGEAFFADSNLSQNERFFFLPSAPQTDVLKYADLFVFHGGMGSLNEAIEYEVPMLIYPMNKEGDNLGDAARVCFHQMGERGDMKDSVSKIRNTLKTALNNNAVCKKNIQVFKKANPYSSADEFLKLIAH